MEEAPKALKPIPQQFTDKEIITAIQLVVYLDITGTRVVFAEEPGRTAEIIRRLFPDVAPRVRVSKR